MLLDNTQGLLNLFEFKNNHLYSLFQAEYEFKKPGIYLYQCTPHKAMGMIGIVVVGGDKSNLEKIKKVKLYGKSKKIFKKLLKEL